LIQALFVDERGGTDLPDNLDDILYNFDAIDLHEDKFHATA